MRTDETLTGLRIVESDLPLPARAPQNDFKITVESFFEWANDPAWNDSQVRARCSFSTFAELHAGHGEMGSANSVVLL